MGAKHGGACGQDLYAGAATTQMKITQKRKFGMHDLGVPFDIGGSARRGPRGGRFYFGKFSEDVDK